jgi:hypothetical protein
MFHKLLHIRERYHTPEEELTPMLHKLLHIRERYHTPEELTPMLHKLLHIREREGTLPNPFCEDSLTQIPKLDRQHHQHQKISKQTKKP